MMTSDEMHVAGETTTRPAAQVLRASADSRNNESAGCQTRMPLDGMPISGGAAPVTRSARWFSPASRDRRIAQRYHWAIRGRPPDASRPRAAANGGLTSSGARPYGCGIGTTKPPAAGVTASRTSGLLAFRLALRGVLDVHRTRRGRAAQANNHGEDIDIDLEQIEIARHLAQLLALAAELLGSVDRGLALGDAARCLDERPRLHPLEARPLCVARELLFHEPPPGIGVRADQRRLRHCPQFVDRVVHPFSLRNLQSGWNKRDQVGASHNSAARSKRCGPVFASQPWHARELPHVGGDENSPVP